MADIFSNNAVTTLDGAIDDDDASLTVDDASAFPASGDFTIIVESEIMLVTGVSSNTFTVSRGQEGTAAASHSNGVGVRHILTADWLNDTQSNLATLVTALSLKYGARVKANRTTDQAISNSTNTAIQFNAADTFDTDNFHDPSTNNHLVTIPASMGGVYLMVGRAAFDPSATGNRLVFFSGTNTYQGVTVPGGSSNTQNVTATAIQSLSAGDTVQLTVFQSSGGSLDVSSAELTLIKLT